MLSLSSGELRPEDVDRSKRGAVRVIDIRKHLRELPDNRDVGGMGKELGGCKLVNACTLTSKVLSDERCEP